MCHRRRNSLNLVFLSRGFVSNCPSRLPDRYIPLWQRPQDPFLWVLHLSQYTGQSAYSRMGSHDHEGAREFNWWRKRGPDQSECNANLRLATFELLLRVNLELEHEYGFLCFAVAALTFAACKTQSCDR